VREGFQHRGSLSGRTHRSPVSNHSSDFPNSRLILNRMTAPISTFPCSIVERLFWLTPMRRTNSSRVTSKPNSNENP
jgi:hypothetical protein